MKETPIAQSDLPRMMEIAETAIRRAGAYLVQKPGSATVEYQKSPFDDLLDVDLEAERIILTILREESPHLGILSEESGHKRTHNQYWIVDPLDGSANFQHGSPLFAISIALVTNGATTGGMIYLPTRDEMFVAMQDQGAYLNGTRIKVSTVATMSEAIAHVGDFRKNNDAQTIPERLKDASILAKQVRRIRMIGTAATDLAYVACGRAEILINYARHPWDIEAGKLLLLEAGGKVTTQRRHNDTTLAIYSNRSIHQSVVDLLISNEN
jgi:myo-inositol-1(or 4)-monophosphatase